MYSPEANNIVTARFSWSNSLDEIYSDLAYFFENKLCINFSHRSLSSFPFTSTLCIKLLIMSDNFFDWLWLFILMFASLCLWLNCLRPTSDYHCKQRKSFQDPNMMSNTPHHHKIFKDTQFETAFIRKNLPNSFSLLLGSQWRIMDRRLNMRFTVLGGSAENIFFLRVLLFDNS